MKTIIRLVIFSILLMVAAPAWSDDVMHVIRCDQDEGTTDDQVEAIAAEWLKAARAVEGGENLELRLNFPVAAMSGDVDIVMALFAPSFTEWGTFMDNYAESAAADIDDKYEDDMDCGDGTLWESVVVK